MPFFQSTDNIKQKTKLSQFGFISQALLVLLLLAGVGVGTYLVQQRTNILPKALYIPGEVCQSSEIGNKNACGQTRVLNTCSILFVDNNTGAERRHQSSPGREEICKVYEKLIGAVSKGETVAGVEYTCTWDPPQCPSGGIVEGSGCYDQFGTKKNPGEVWYGDCNSKVPGSRLQYLCNLDGKSVSISHNEDSSCPKSEQSGAGGFCGQDVAYDKDGKQIEDCKARGLKCTVENKVSKCSGTGAPVPAGGAAEAAGGGAQTLANTCTFNGQGYQAGGKRYECSNTQGPCASDAGVGVPFVCNSDGSWSNANEAGECTTECKVTKNTADNRPNTNLPSADDFCGTDTNGVPIPCYKLGVFDAETLANTKQAASVASRNYQSYTKVLGEIKDYIGDLEAKVAEKNADLSAKAQACLAQ